MSQEINLNFSEYESYLNQYPEDVRATLKMQLEHGLDEALDYIKEAWSQVTYGKRMLRMTQSVFDLNYAPSLRIERRGFKARVYTDYPGADVIAHGRPSIDLKPGLLAGPSSRVSHQGHRYNIVHFGHASPSGSIRPLPEDVYRAALRGTPITPQSEMGQRQRRPGWSVGPYAGLRREQTGPRSQGTTYSTYRTVSDRHRDTQKWVIPSMPPIDLPRIVQEYTEPQVHEILTRFIS